MGNAQRIAVDLHLATEAGKGDLAAVGGQHPPHSIQAKSAGANGHHQQNR
jgi:hypothetical protein